MSTDLEEAITETLRPRGDGPVDVTTLRRAAVRQGRSIRRRRMVTASVGVVLVAVVLGAVPVLRGGFLHGGGPGGGLGGRAGGPGTEPGTGVPALPAADAPGAAARPDLVGKDPALLHFDVDLTGTLATGAFWSVRDGVESVRLWTSDFDHFNHEYQLATDPARLQTLRPDDGEPAQTRQVSVGGRPATAKFWPDQVSSNKKPDVATWSVDWQPVDGLWARVSLHTPDAADAVRAAEALMPDRSQRCVAPVRLASPAGYSHMACAVDFGHIFAWTVSNVEVERADGVRFDIGIGHFTLGSDTPFVPNQMVGNRPAMLRTDGSGQTTLFVPVAKDINLVVRPYRVGTEGGHPFAPAGLTDAEIVEFAEGIVIGPNLLDLDSWPTSPLVH